MYSPQIWPIYLRTATINCTINKTHVFLMILYHKSNIIIFFIFQALIVVILSLLLWNF